MLLEVLLALAVFVMGGIAILALVDGSISGLRATRDTQRAADLARSAVSMIEAGIARPETLNGPAQRWDPGTDVMGDDEADSAGFEEAPPSGSGWELEIDTEPSRFDGLTKLTVRAFKTAAPDSGRVAASYTLTQLVRLGANVGEEVGELDRLAEEGARGARDSAGGEP